MTTILYDEDAKLDDIAGEKIAILGYGNQGRSQALNLRDSGQDVVVGNIEDDYRKTAIADGFAAVTIGEAAARADILFLLTPDEVMPEVYARDVMPHVSATAVILRCHVEAVVRPCRSS